MHPTRFRLGLQTASRSTETLLHGGTNNDKSRQVDLSLSLPLATLHIVTKKTVPLFTRDSKVMRYRL